MDTGPSQEHEHGHGHGHGHGHDGDGPSFDDWDAVADELIRDGEISMPYLEQVMEWLVGLRAGQTTQQIVDVGSGPGVATCLLAAAFPGAELMAVDGATGLLDRAQARADEHGLGHRLTTRQLSLDSDLGQVPEADLIWASRVVHHLPDQVTALRSLAARLRPGGHLVLVEGGLASRFLPEESGFGAPGLLDRLDAAVSLGLAPLLRHDDSSPVPRPTLNWPDQLAEAGLTPSGSRTFLLDLPAPVTPQVREHLAHRLRQTSPLAGDHLSDADQDSVDGLLDQAHPLSVWNRPDLFLISASTVHTARRP